MDARALELLHLRTPAGDTAAITPHGAQLLSWRTADGVEHLYRSPLATPAAGRVVRGGTPVCFPQFAARGPLPKHGFVRDRAWQVRQPLPAASEATEAVLAIDDAAAAWDRPFEAVVTVRLGSGWIEIELQARNPGPTAFQFTGALHTYFAVDDVRSAAVHGLQGLAYQDALDGDRVKQEPAPAVTFAGELDRVYLDTPSPLRLVRPGRPALRISQQGFTDTVVWNPGPRKAATLGDMPPADWLKMVCVEAAVVKMPVTVAAGATWTGLQRIALA
jgi:glucose-6-phosphate 1-epimerase